MDCEVVVQVMGGGGDGVEKRGECVAADRSGRGITHLRL